jgi:hypothetical protein
VCECVLTFDFCLFFYHGGYNVASVPTKGSGDQDPEVRTPEARRVAFMERFRAIAIEAGKGIPAAVTGSVATMPVPPIRRGLNISSITSAVSSLFCKRWMSQTSSATLLSKKGDATNY